MGCHIASKQTSVHVVTVGLFYHPNSVNLRHSPALIICVVFHALSEARLGVYLWRKFICPCFLAPCVLPCPPHTVLYGHSFFFGQQLPSLTHHMFYRPLKHNAPLLFDIKLFIYFPVSPVSPYE